MDHKITVKALVLSDIQSVWDGYTQPEQITKWNFASDSWHCPAVSNDLRPGGKYVARMEARDQSFGFDFEAVYDEIVDKKKIAYTMADGRKAVVAFDADKNHTAITLSFDAEQENSSEMQRTGWQAILDNFKKYVESHASA